MGNWNGNSERKAEHPFKLPGELRKEALLAAIDLRTLIAGSALAFTCIALTGLSTATKGKIKPLLHKPKL